MDQSGLNLVYYCFSQNSGAPLNTTLGARSMFGHVAVLISALALLFTVFSFWWMNWRSGKLVVVDLQHFAAGRGRVGHPDELNAWFVGLPLVLLNRGASPLVVESLRLTPTGATEAQALIFNAVDTPLWTDDPQVTKIDRNFTYLPKIIKPNDAISENFVFFGSDTVRKYEPCLYHFHLEAKLFGRRDWKRVKDIKLDFRDFDDQQLYELNTFYKPYHNRRGKLASSV